MLVILLLAMAGALGTLARYGLGRGVHYFTGPGFPWGTLVVNALGCFLFGLVWNLAATRVLPMSENARLIVLTGFMGAFTTFSTFIFDSAVRWDTNEASAAVMNLLLGNVTGLVAVFLGLAVARRLALG